MSKEIKNKRIYQELILLVKDLNFQKGLGKLERVCEEETNN